MEFTAGGVLWLLGEVLETYKPTKTVFKVQSFRLYRFRGLGFRDLGFGFSV